MAPSSSTSTTSPSEKRYPYLTEFNVLDFVPKLLSEGNYQNWKKLMLDFIDSQDLIGFIDGKKAEPEKSNKDDCEAWKISNNLVRRWILATLTEDIRLRVLDFKIAKHLMTELEKRFDTNKSILSDIDEETKSRQGHYLELQRAAINADWGKAKGIIERDPDAVRKTINIYHQTALTIAVKSASTVRNSFVKELLEKMAEEDVNLLDKFEWTALHWAAAVDNIEGAKMLVNKNPSALFGFLPPLDVAAMWGHRKMVLYLMEATREHISLDVVKANRLLYCLTRGELYDIALTLLQRIQRLPDIILTTLYQGIIDLVMETFNPLEVIAEKASSFPSGNRFNFWQRLIYSGIARLHNGEGGRRRDIENQALTVSQRMQFMILEVAEKLVPHVKDIREKKERHHHALELVKHLCTEVAKLDLSEVEKIFRPALRKAVRVGIPEIIEEIVVAYPSALYFVELDMLNIMKYAILHRHERVFNLVYQIGAGRQYISRLDSLENNGLHLVARLGREQQMNLKVSAAGSVLQMQRELQWFKEIEKFTPISERELRNSDGMTAAEIFTDTHQDLVKEGEQWMKDTATSCTIVAALIATMVFAAAITVPGGNDSNSGHPLLSKNNAFIIFGISDALALFSSITSVLMFLLILTSRYAEEDFLSTLPKRLITGLITLFISILFTMIAFCAILYLVFGDNKAWILVPVIALASIPVIFFGTLQLPLLVEMIKSTYGQGIFDKQSDRVLE